MKKKKLVKEEKKVFLELHPQAKKSIVGIIFLLLSLLFLLSGLKSAGPFGNFTFKIFNYLFGFGFWFFPLTLFAIGLVFLASEREQKIYSTVLIGSSVLFLSFLSLIELFFKNKGGFFGKIGASVQKLIGFYGAIVFWSAFFIIGFLISFNLPLRLNFLKSLFRKKKKIELSEKEKMVIPEVKEGVSEKSYLEPREEEKEEKEAPLVIKKLKKKTAKGGKLPPLSLLEAGSEKPKTADLKLSANIIKRTLANFGIIVELAEVNIGPSVTRYTFRPAEGTRLSKIVSLSNEISLALAAHPIRIEAPIPGRSLVGIEVPNKAPSLVRLRPLLENDEFQKGGPLVFPLGRDVAGLPFYADLAKMPHLLIAGSTGSGKSIVIHCLICSLLFKNQPEDLNFILVDPKKVELTLYEDLPHLITPTITEPKKAIGVLKWLINEMEERYDLLLSERVRDIRDYNKRKIERGEKTEPYIVTIIDELADLMATYPREMEASIVRLAQMARATGIHLVVSTQRPSTDVITGLIKANITSRIALEVASQVDSRTILDSAGAEKLLGRGDMLFISPEISKSKRIQGTYVSPKEVKRVVSFWKGYGFERKEEISEIGEKKEGFEEFLDEEIDDPLYPEAYKLVVESQKASASYLQRRLKVGYARAARLLDMLEERRVVGPSRGAKPREVFVKKEDLLEKD